MREYGRYGISRKDVEDFFGKERLHLIEEYLDNGYAVFTHYPEEYAYLDEIGSNEGCLSYRVSLEYLVKENIPLLGI